MMDIAPRLNRKRLPEFESESLLGEEEARDRRSDESTEAAANEEDGGEPTRDILLLGDPGETGTELP